jgi:hypothetical protein
MMTDLKNLRDTNPVDPSLYPQLIGSLMYLENTQPDICFVGRLSYDMQLRGFIDSDWVGSADDKRNATLICFSLCYQHRDNIVLLAILSAKSTSAILSAK